ncbi:MAG: hypothetical protein Q7U60_02555, partial [Candidatus Methanoperedens sp.]|nr:hypothetical protein [Candidatus Methanoperedens sp.]
MKLEESYASSLRKGDKLGAKAIERSIEKVDDEIYKLGATAWIDRKGIPETWLDSLRAYKQPERIEEISGPFFTGSPIKDSLGSTVLSKETNLEKFLVKKGTLPDSWFDEREALRQEIEFINNYLINPEMAQGYAQQAATPYFFKYWSEKGGIAGIKEYLQALKNKARSEGVDFAETKFGELSTIKDVKKTPFSFATVRGKVTDIWQPGSPKQSQVGLIQDATGEKIKFTFWKNQPGFPTLELGKTYMFGNVPVSEYKGSWGLTANKDSVVKEIEPMAFTTVSPRPLIGASTELRDYSKPSSIDPVKGTITYTTKSGKVVEMPVPEAEITGTGAQKITGKKVYSPYDKWSAQQERDLFNPYAAFV